MSTSFRLTAAVMFAGAVGLLPLHLAAQAKPAPPAVSLPKPQASNAEAALVAKAKGIHDRAIKADSHNDISANNFTDTCNYTMRLTSQVNLPKMIEGDMDVSFMVVYSGQGPLTPEGYDNAYKRSIELFDGIHRLTEKIAPDKIGLALTPADVLRLHKAGKRIVVIGVENGYSIGYDIRRVKEFYDRGGRYLSLTHNGNSQLADSNTGEVQGYLYNNGLSPLGRQVIAELNRLGMIIDLSHPSKGANLEAIRLSKAPVMASHSSARALANHSRNMDDELLMAVKKNGGVVQTVAFASYVKVDPPQRATEMAKLNADFGLGGGGRGAGGAGGRASAAGAGRAAGAPSSQAGTLPSQAATGRAAGAAAPCPIEDPNAPAGARGGGRGAGGRGNAALDALSADRRAEYDRRLAEINATWPAAARANVKDFVDHIDYLVKKIGVEHVGISSDFDGGGGVDGFNSAAEAFNVTLELVRRGYSERDIDLIWSGNLLRVWSQVEQVAKQLQGK